MHASFFENQSGTTVRVWIRLVYRPSWGGIGLSWRILAAFTNIKGLFGKVGSSF